MKEKTQIKGYEGIAGIKKNKNLLVSPVIFGSCIFFGQLKLSNVCALTQINNQTKDVLKLPANMDQLGKEYWLEFKSTWSVSD